MNLFGSGLWMALITLFYTVLLYFWIRSVNFDFRILFVPKIILNLLGGLLIISGFLFLAASIKAMREAVIHKMLYTKGVYSVCRHPIYSAWIFFILPGMVFLVNSWILFSVPLVLLLSFRVLIHREENGLVQSFGKDYLDYMKKTGLIFPRFRKCEK